MPSPQLFKVLTEFQFEVGSAVVQSEQLQGSIAQLSNQAREAQFAINRLGLAIVSDLGGGLTGFLSFLRTATTASENFTKAQLGIAQILSANANNFKTNFNINDFGEQKKFSAQIIKDVSKDAIKFGLDQQSLFETTKLISGLLAPKGLTGQNFGTSRELSRNLLKASPALGLNPVDVQGQLLRSIEGSASMGDTFFVRLANETSVFQEKFKGAANVAKEFNKLPVAERLKTINTGLAQFTNNAEVLTGFQQLISNQLRTIRELFMGLNSVLIPVGDVITKLVKEVLAQFIKIMDTNVRGTIENLSVVMRIFADDAKGLYASLSQVSQLSSDIKAAGLTTTIILVLQFVGFMRVFNFLFKALGVTFIGISRGVSFLLSIFGGLRTIFSFIVIGAAKFSLAILPLVVLFQTLSRALAIAKVNDALLLPEILEKISKSFADIMVVLDMVFAPAVKFFNAIAESIAPVFQWSTYLNLAVDAMKLLSDSLVVLFGIIRGFVFSIGQFIENISQGKLLGAFDGVLDQFTVGVDDFFEEFLNRTQDNRTGNQAVANNVTNIGKVEIRNEFKDKLEPDRIAFTVKDQLLKAAQNPVAAKGRSFAIGASGR